MKRYDAIIIMGPRAHPWLRDRFVGGFVAVVFVGSFEVTGTAPMMANGSCWVFQHQNLGTLKGRYQFLRALFLPNCVCRHRSMSITYDSLLPCHGRGRGFESRRPRHSSTEYLVNASGVSFLRDPHFVSEPSSSGSPHA